MTQPLNRAQRRAQNKRARGHKATKRQLQPASISPVGLALARSLMMQELESLRCSAGIHAAFGDDWEKTLRNCARWIFIALGCCGYMILSKRMEEEHPAVSVLRGSCGALAGIAECLEIESSPEVHRVSIVSAMDWIDQIKDDWEDWMIAINIERWDSLMAGGQDVFTSIMEKQLKPEMPSLKSLAHIKSTTEVATC